MWCGSLKEDERVMIIIYSLWRSTYGRLIAATILEERHSNKLKIAVEMGEYVSTQTLVNKLKTVEVTPVQIHNKST